MMFLFRKIRNTILCHSELGSESRDVETKKRVQGDKIFKKTLAFTLAETLIVMGIIGVVAALTIPNLNSSTADKEKVAKVKKIYSNLNDALGRAQVVYGPVEEWKQLDSTKDAQTARFGERLTEFMKVSKNCGIDNRGCFPDKEIKFRSGAASGVQADGGYYYRVILADGSSVGLSNGTIEVDIDGPNKGSAQLGYDMFLFRCLDGEVVPFSIGGAFIALLNNLKQNGEGQSASLWIINYDNMDYLKLDSSGKCPNGTTPTEQNPRCK